MSFPFLKEVILPSKSEAPRLLFGECLFFFSRPKGTYGTTDEDFVLLSLRACLSYHANPQGSVRGRGGGGGGGGGNNGGGVSPIQHSFTRVILAGKKSPMREWDQLFSCLPPFPPPSPCLEANGLWSLATGMPSPLTLSGYSRGGTGRDGVNIPLTGPRGGSKWS